MKKIIGYAIIFIFAASAIAILYMSWVQRVGYGYAIVWTLAPFVLCAIIMQAIEWIRD